MTGVFELVLKAWIKTTDGSFKLGAAVRKKTGVNGLQGLFSLGKTFMTGQRRMDDVRHRVMPLLEQRIKGSKGPIHHSQCRFRSTQAQVAEQQTILVSAVLFINWLELVI